MNLRDRASRVRRRIGCPVFVEEEFFNKTSPRLRHKSRRKKKTKREERYLILASAVAQIPVRGVSFIDDSVEEELVIAKFDPKFDDIELLLLLGGGGGGEKRKKALFAFSSSSRR